jgi:hypothetical protein
MSGDADDRVPPTDEPSFPDESAWLDPSSTISDLLEKKHQTELALLRDDFQIRESALLGQVQMLETRALTAEQQLEEFRSALIEQEEKVAQSKESANQFQKDMIQSNYRYQTLLQNLFATFQCSRLEDVLACAEQFRDQKTQIENLQKSLLETQLLLSAETMRRTDLGLNPDSGNSQRLEEQVRVLEKTVHTQQESLSGIEAARDAERREHVTSMSIKVAELDRLNSELKKQIELNKTLVDENVELKASPTDKRLQRIAYVSRRIDPAFLGLERTSLLHPMYESISSLLQSIGDPEIDSTVLEQSLAKVRDDITAASSEINGSRGKVSSEPVASLRMQLDEETAQRRELEEAKAQLEEELDELRNDDKAPEVFALRMKVHEQAEQIRQLVERGKEPLPSRRRALAPIDSG